MLKSLPSISQAALDDIQYRLTSPKREQTRVPFSVRYPHLKPYILFARQTYTTTKHALNRSIARSINKSSLPHRIHKHQSLLRRKLGKSDARLQENKITNLEKAIASIDGIMIKPGQTFSLWTLVGRPSAKKGYVHGMLLSKGQVIEGLGGGLCQLANLLHWMFLHGPLQIVERYHHSLDVFPDSGRTIPFGSGATILYNFIDLKAKNTSDHPLQIRLWLTEDKLYGDLRTASQTDSYKVRETDHCFIHHKNTWYRYNRLWRVGRLHNRKLVSELAVTNLAPVLYKVSELGLKRKGYTVIKV